MTKLKTRSTTAEKESGGKMISLDLNLDIGLPPSMVAGPRNFTDTGTFLLNSDMIPLAKDPLVEDDFFIGGVSLRELSADPQPPQKKR
ncbi:hypothetical protein KIK84_08455 [Curvibacter sp. CHRR-16]|uniref:hypothetical protein n=1 Tax=Curvibacter sp. CHRR-16 TaxID=2835872 RepID=UPI001BD9A5DE|nr:hypothetical protein [Curvibacter sp. CHRR-16]MBT0570356.1 hypothetical protein [Curvibacter sp. CHRR-16]